MTSKRAILILPITEDFFALAAHMHQCIRKDYPSTTYLFVINTERENLLPE